MKICFSDDCEDCGPIGFVEFVKELIRKFKKKPHEQEPLPYSSQWVTREALRILNSQLAINRSLSGEVKETIRIRLPNRYAGKPEGFTEGGGI